MIYLSLFLTFLEIGAFTFGGGYAMLPLMQQEVLEHEWMTESELLDFIAISESTPGPVAINMATFIGVKTAGLFGAFCATFGVVLPSFVIILIVAKFYQKYKNSFTVKGMMTGLRPAVIGLIASAVISLSANVFIPNGFEAITFNLPFFTNIFIFGLTLFFAFKKCSQILLILLSASLGIVSGHINLIL